MMDLAHLMAQMETTARAIRDLAQRLPPAEVRWQPEPDAWSVLDVLNHLVYEERHDFIERLDLALHRPQGTWPSYDSNQGVTEEGRQQDPEAVLQAFLAARDDSLAWLRALETPAWDAVCQAPFGEIRAGDILAAWAAHDLLHLRQLVELCYQILARGAEPYGVRYAGEW